MSDLVQRLHIEVNPGCNCGLCSIAREAADRIEILENELERNEGILHLRQKRIEEFENKPGYLWLTKLLVVKDKRIKELEAALRKLLECEPEGPDDTHPDSPSWEEWQFARRALEGK